MSNLWIAFSFGGFLGVVVTIFVIGFIQILDQERKSPHYRQNKRKAIQRFVLFLIAIAGVLFMFYIF